MSLKCVMLLMKDVSKGTKFYSKLGCKVKYSSEHWAELKSGKTTLALKKVEGSVGIEG